MRVPAYDAWVLARLLADQPIHGEVAEVSETFRPLAERMAATPRAGRKALLRKVSLSLPDPFGVIKAICEVDPMEPAPDPDADRIGAGLPIRLTRAADIRARPVEWLWEGRVPLGMLSLWAGAPKLGKSYVSLSLAAAVSRGAPAPHSSTPRGPARVILMSAEDDPARTIIPRLQAAGADLSRIHVLESVVLEGGAEALPSLRNDMAHLEAAADRLGDCRLIVIDPISAYLGGVNDHGNVEVRGILSPLKVMAERLGVAVVLLSHLNKGGSANAQHRVIGSVAYVGACRANFLFVKDREDLTGRRVLMLDNGGNLAPPAPTLAYVIEDRGDGPRVEWFDEPVPITAEEAMAADRAAQQASPAAPERHQVEEWLSDVLRNGPVPAQKVTAAARTAGLSEITLKRAKARLRVESVREGYGIDARWHWRLTPAGSR
jgi:putative DNA primase/helicase